METNFNFKSQVATSLEQSERLLALGLKKETADCRWTGVVKDSRGKDIPKNEQMWFLQLSESENYQTCGFSRTEFLPAWSLHRLLCMLPRCVEGGYHLAISYDHIEYRTTYSEVTTWWRGGGNTYDMIIETIEWLIKEGYFNKEYLV